MPAETVIIIAAPDGASFADTREISESTSAPNRSHRKSRL